MAEKKKSPRTLSEQEATDAINRAHEKGHPLGPGEVKPPTETIEERGDRMRKGNEEEMKRVQKKVEKRVVPIGGE
jgi:hypothetical protein